MTNFTVKGWGISQKSLLSRGSCQWGPDFVDILISRGRRQFRQMCSNLMVDAPVTGARLSHSSGISKVDFFDEQFVKMSIHFSNFHQFGHFANYSASTTWWNCSKLEGVQQKLNIFSWAIMLTGDILVSRSASILFPSLGSVLKTKIPECTVLVVSWDLVFPLPPAW